MRNTSAVLRKLSLNAAKNWQANSGAKRLDSKSDPMRDYGKVPPARDTAHRPKKYGRPAGRPSGVATEYKRYRTTETRALRGLRAPSLSKMMAPTAKPIDIAVTMLKSEIHMAVPPRWRPKRAGVWRWKRARIAGVPGPRANFCAGE
jgi:hypothetical protein